MPAPWETGALPAAPAKKPWELTPEESAAVAKSKGIVQHEKSQPTLIQRMPEGVSKVDRALIANFSNDPVAAMDWLQTKYPDFDIALVGDQIGMKPKGAPQDYMAIVPKFRVSEIVKNPTEFLNQVSDVAYDLTAGIASGGAGALGAGAGLATGPGALATGAAAAGATGAALEAGRQQIGKEIGLNKEIKPEQVATSGVLNAAAVPLFGAGGVKGLAGGAYDWVAGRALPKAGEVISGVPADAIRNYAKHAPTIKQMQKEGVLDLTEQTHEAIVKPLSQAKMDVGAKLGEAVDNAGGSIDLAAAKRPWDDLLTKLNREYDLLRTPELKKKLADVTEQYKFHFSREPLKDDAGNLLLDSYGNPVTEVMSMRPSQAFDLKQSMADLGGLDKVKSGTKSSLADMTPAQKEIANAARQSKKALDTGIENAVANTEAATGNMGTFRQQYRELSNLQNYLDKYFKTPEATFNTMSNLQGKNKKILNETLANMDKTYGTDALKNAEIFDAYKYFGDASFNPLSTKGSTSTGRAIPLATAMGGLGAYASTKAGVGPLPGLGLGIATGATVGSPAAIAKYTNVGRGVRGVQGLLGPMQSTPAQVIGNIKQDYSKPNPWTLFGTPIEEKKP